jgi:beta-N-acetylhexosaminidase
MKHMPLGPLIIGIENTALTEADRARLHSRSVGGVILFTRNFESPAQLSKLCDDIHSIRSSPLPIFVDHEGGRVQRFRENFTHIPAMRTLAKAFATDQLQGLKAARACGFVLAAELRACGVDVSFTPVLDIDYGRSDVIGDRALGSDANTVTQLAAALIHGMQMAGMQGCGKHYPGHGWAHADSHFEQPVDERPLEEILKNDAAPYGHLGASVIASVMPAHVVYTAVDSQPAGFSKVWLQDILRGRLGYKGVIVSDDLGMAGAHSAGHVVDRAKIAIEAGCDAVLACNEFDEINALVDAKVSHVDPESSVRMERLSPRMLGRDFVDLQADADYLDAVAIIRTLQAS